MYFGINKKYIITDLKVLSTKKLIRNAFKQIRKVICKNLKIDYQNGLLGNKNEGKYNSVNETMNNYYDGKQIWLLGICGDNAEEFRKKALYKRDTETQKNLSFPMQTKGTIITDG